MNRSTRAFTIVELLVVVSIVTVLVGILLPAIGKGLDRAKVVRSQANLRNLMAAANTYAADWNDRQFTLTIDNISKYGSDPESARAAWIERNAGSYFRPHRLWPKMELGIVWDADTPDHAEWEWLWLVTPISFDGDHKGYGWFRHPNCGQFNEYLTGRYYDPVFYPPKDKVSWSVLEGCLDAAGEFADCSTGDAYYPHDQQIAYPAGYSFSPAALMSPDVLNADHGYEDFEDPWQLPSGWKCPSMSMSRFPDLKTLMFEHHWLQNAPKPCNPNFGTDGTWDGCEPYYFNHGYTSAPVTLFYDGHIELLGQHEAIAADRQVAGQTPAGTGLWHRQAMGSDGYFMNLGYDMTETSHNILTVDGIRGRDKIAR